jgi:hypothetical protein
MKKVRYILGFIFVRPRRWLFRNMVRSTKIRWGFDRTWDNRILMPNIHWWILYKTVFNFFKWLDYDAWRPLCKWGDRYRLTYPWYAHLIQRIGETTAGYAISGFECFHCGSPDGCQVELSNDESGEFFTLLDTWTDSTQDGIDYRFKGITICPKCGYRSEYECGSL